MNSLNVVSPCPTHVPGPTAALNVAGSQSSLMRIRRVSDAAALVVDAIRADRFWVLTHPSYRSAIERRTRGIVETDEVIAGDFR